ncbi:unnamed protein product [Lupinus luteus]|uniref:S-protein homolog n=1 Tax=Lupinus luteus TaxID=3873 RepID=A0AAV1X8I9_LUPLU
MNSIFMNKSVLLLMLLTIFVTLQMMAGMVYGKPFDNTKVMITNNMTFPLLVHCRDKFREDGLHNLLAGVSHHIKFYKVPLIRFIWSCRFEWRDGSGHYNIYDSNRDRCKDYNCFWLINKSGPCQNFHDNKTPVCYSW